MKETEKVKTPMGRTVDLGIYSQLSKAGIKELSRMMSETSPGARKKSVRKQKDKKESAK